MSRLRNLRRARGLTLAEVAARCDPPTTAVTVGRLETGMRRLSVDWVERLARALAVSPAELLSWEGAGQEIPVAARLAAGGAEACRATTYFAAPAAPPATIGVAVDATLGDYRAGDELWLERLEPEAAMRALNADVLVPRPVGRFAFGRLIRVEAGRLLVLPPAPGGRQLAIADPPWLARVTHLFRRVARD